MQKNEAIKQAIERYLRGSQVKTIKAISIGIHKNRIITDFICQQMVAEGRLFKTEFKPTGYYTEKTPDGWITY